MITFDDIRYTKADTPIGLAYDCWARDLNYEDCKNLAIMNDLTLPNEELFNNVLKVAQEHFDKTVWGV